MRLVLSLVSLLVVVSSSHALGTSVSGTISTNTTWTKANAPYVVTGATTVATGVTLTIEAGVVVQFAGWYPFTVQGRLNANGTAKDSVLFVKEPRSDTWLGLEFVGSDSSTLSYTRISDVEEDDTGGAVNVGGTARLRLSHCVIAYNTGINGGAIFNGDGTKASIVYADWTVMHSNHAVYDGSAVFTRTTAKTYLTNCTIAGNVSGTSGYAVFSDAGTVNLLNCIVWGNGKAIGVLNGGSVTATTSDIETATVYPGTNNKNVDPLFLNPAVRDYRLQAGSPCIGTGTGGEVMGAFAYVPTTLNLLEPVAKPGDSLLVTIRGTFLPAYSVDVAFLINKAVIIPDTVGKPLVYSHAFSSAAGGTVWSNFVGDTLFLSFTATERVGLTNQPLVSLRFRVAPGAVGGDYFTVFVPSETSIDEQPVDNLNNGKVYVQTLGDVTKSSGLTAADATEILKFVVRLRPAIDIDLADVTCNQKVTSFDAAWVLQKVLHPEYLFPCEGGGPLPRPAGHPALVLRWQREGDAWLLFGDHAGALAGDLTLALGSEDAVNATGSGTVVVNQDGSVLHVGLVDFSGEPLLLRIEGAGVSAQPLILAADFNDGEYRISGSRPVALALEQNVPNPFNPSTTIQFRVPDAGFVKLAIYGIDGQLVRSLTAQHVEAGVHEAVWDGRDNSGRAVASGVYVYRLTSDRGVISRRMVLAR
ncbi:MAG TPA: FlgD immunoglobulin-like domain containing protein [Candidatus Latescibacteria bacterium]|nr:FlgD immunoglobulin-like domain containing protein [Candidatus Latescibacterota bacterium]